MKIYQPTRINRNGLPQTNYNEVGYWHDYKITINMFYNKAILEYFLRSFWENVMSNLNTDQYVLIQMKVSLSDKIYRSVSYMQRVNKSDYNKLFDILLEFWSERDAEYYQSIIHDFIFTYKILPNIQDLVIESKLLRHNKIVRSEKGTFNFKGFRLNNNMDIFTWGKVRYNNKDNTKFIISKPESLAEYYIKLFDNYLTVDYKVGDQILFSYKDVITDPKSENPLYSFTRTLKSQEYIFVDGEKVVRKIARQVNFLSKDTRKETYFRSTNFITMDLETRTINGKMEPICVSCFDGNKTKSFYLSDYTNPQEMLESSIRSLMIRKYHNYKIYFHNFSYFDGIFLLKVLSKISDKIKPIIRDNKLIDLRLHYDDKYVLYFRDSLLLLPSSLAKLAKNFNVENKGIFPYSFVNNSSLSLNYEGNIPEINYFNNISLEQYEEYCAYFTNIKWNLRTELIKYCEQDVVTLYQVINTFSTQIFDLFGIDINKTPTVSSLAFLIYRNKFLKKEMNIPLITGITYNDIKKGYTGGSVDVYKPYGKNIRIYDVNSLYPYVMKKYPMPVGKPIYFEGDISLTSQSQSLRAPQNRPFGIFDVEVEAPVNLNIPILQTKLMTPHGGLRTVSPLGNWSGTYFSEEIYNAMEYGYKFKVLRGYLFEKGYIFNDYVDTLYKLKLNSTKNSPNYIISKLLLNSLYGRMGMDPDSLTHEIIDSTDYDKLLSLNITNLIDFDNGKELISYFKNSENIHSNVSIPIALAVTAYGRIHMSKFKMLYSDNIYYTDTDSIALDIDIDPQFVGTEIGQMKLEHIFDKAVFLAPKVYGGITDKYEYVKVKGLKNPVSFEQLESLLIKDTKLEILQEKWYRNVKAGNISIKNEIYSLIVTDNKRDILRDKHLFIGTKPLVLNNGVLATAVP